jgi:hypothetical protein
MTEIMIRDGVITTLPSTWTILAWDSTRNNSNAPLTNNVAIAYSVWNEFDLTTNYNIVSTFNKNDANASTVFYDLPGTDLSGSIVTYPGMQASVWSYRGNAIGPWAGTVGFGGVLQMAFSSIASDVRQLLLSVGSKNSENEPSWAYASMNYWFDASNLHDYIECRVGITIKKVKLNQFDKTIPHLYVIYKDTFSSQIRFYVDNLLVASIPLLSTSDPEWSTVNQNDDLDTWWAFSDYGYVPSAGTPATYTDAYTLFVISYGGFGVNHTPLLDLCRYRYGIITDANTASTHIITLDGSMIAIFDISDFDTTFI